MEFFHFVIKKFVLKSYGEIQDGKVWNALVEKKSSVRALAEIEPPNHVEKIGELHVRGVRAERE